LTGGSSQATGVDVRVGCISSLTGSSPTLRQLWHAHLRNKGRHGSPAARRLLQAASDGARSEAERLLVKLLRGAGITGWRTNYPVGGYKVDVAFPKQKVAIETDG
jgi:very-short-patch-repair endonuclease